MKRGRSIFSLLAAVSLPMLSQAQDGSWAVDAGGLWSSAGNWSGGLVATGTDATAYFTNAITASRDVTNDLPGQAIGHLTFDGGANAWTLSGERLTLSQTSGSSLLSVLSGTAAIGAPLAGGPGVVKLGAGTLALGGASTYSGSTMLSGGTVTLGGGAAIPGFGDGANWRVNSTNVGGTAIAGDQLTLTTGAGSQARTAFHTTRQSMAGGFAQSVTYVASGARTADGWSFLIHNDGRGTNFLGAPGGALSLNGVTQSVAVAFNIYNADGVRLVTNAVAIGGYQASAPVAIDSGNPINVTFVHDAAAGTLTVLLAEVGTTNRKTYVFTNVSLPDQTKTNAAYVGFTGTTGGSAAIQNLSGEASFFNNVLPVGTAVVLPSGSVLDLSGTGQAMASLSDGGGAGGVVTNSGAVAAAIAFVPTNGATTAFSGTIADGAGTNVISVVMMGSGEQELTGVNAYRGGTLVNGGRLAIQADANLGSTNGLLSLGGGTLVVDGTFTLGRPVFLPAGGGIDVASGQTLTVGDNGFTSGSAGLLAKGGDGALVLNQTSGYNPWSGALVIHGGLVLANGSFTDGTIRGNVTINSGGLLRLGSANRIINTSIVRANGGGVFDLNSFSDAVGFVAGGGTVTNVSNLILDLGAGSQTLTGNIGGMGPVVIRGAAGAAGIQVFEGTNTFTGGLNLQGGTLGIVGDAGLGAAGGAVTFSGGTLLVAGTAVQNLDSRPVNWNAFNGGLDIADAANVFTITNALSGASSFTKGGAGLLRLTATNDHTGGTFVRAGTLAIGAGAAILGSPVTVNTGAQLTVEGGAGIGTNVSVNLLSSGTNYAKLHLSNAVSMTVLSLAFNGLAQTIGTWGGAGSGAANIDTNFFTGPGVLNVTGGTTGAGGSSSWAVDAGGEWYVVTNWQNNAIPAGTNTTAYFTNAITANRTVNNNAPSTDIGNMVFGSPANSWTVASNVLRLVVDAGAPVISVTTGTASIASVLNGAQGLTKSGAGSLQLTAGSVFTGPMTVGAGEVQIAGAGSVFSNGSAAGSTIAVNGGATLTLNRGDTFGNHAATPRVDLAIGAGALVQNTNQFNTLNGVTLSGGELRANGGSATFGAYQIKGTVTVSGASASLIAGTTAGNEFNSIQLGNNQPGGITTFAVADATADPAADLVVATGFADGRNTGNTANAASGFVINGPGSVRMSGNSVNTGPSTINNSRVTVAGSGTLNAPVHLTNGSTLVAVSGPGLLGEYFLPGATPVTANFALPSALSAHLGTINPALLYNFPVGSTNFSFNDAPVTWPTLGTIVNFETRWRGKFNAPVGGDYTFTTQNDDGSMLWIDGQLVVNNNAFQSGTAVVTGIVNLVAGPHDIEIAYFQGTGGYRVFVNVALPGGQTNRLSNGLVSAGPGVGGLSGDASAAVIISNTVLTVAQTNDTTFAGTITATGASALRKLGLGTLTLTAANSLTNTILGGGRVSIAGDAQIGGAASGLVFDGGLLQLTGTGLANLDTHSVNWPSFVGGFDIAAASHVFTVTDDIGAAGVISSLRKTGPGTLVLAGNASILNGGLRADHGVLALVNAAIAVQSNVASVVGNAAGDRAALILQGNANLVSSSGPLWVGNAAGSAGAIHQNGGSILCGGEVDIANNAGSYGFFSRLAGTSTNAAYTQASRGGVGLYYQSGGSHAQTGQNFLSCSIAGTGTGVVYITGGTHTNAGDLVAGWANGTRNEWTISGGSVFAPNVQMNRGTNDAILNLNGGTLQAGSIYKQSVGATGTLNLDGGTLQARVTGNLLGAGAQPLDNAYVHDGGATIDSSAGYSVTIAQNLLAPPGSGVTAIPVATGGAGYIGAPYVQITGGGGTGATAVAVVDLATNSPTFGQVTAVLVTCPGVNYSSAPSVAFVGGGYAVAATPGLPSIGANASGGLNLTGSGSVALLGTNTYGGATVVSNGILLVGSTNALGVSSLVIAAPTAGIGPVYPLDQDFVNWLTTKLEGATSPGIIALGASSTNALDLSALTNWSLGAAGGNQAYGGALTLSSTNLYLGGGNGTLTYAANIGTGTNVFIGINGGKPVVQLNGSNAAYASEMNIVSGTLKGGITNCLGGIAARINVPDGTTLDVNGTRLGPAHIYVAGSGVSGGGAIVNSGGDAITPVQNIHLTADTTFGGPSRWDINNLVSAGFLDLNGFTLTKTNANTIDIWVANVSDGNIVVGQGILRFEANGSITGGVGTITVGPSGNLNFWNLNGAVTRAITMQGGVMSVGSGTARVGSAIALLPGYTNKFDTGATTRSLVLTGLVNGAGGLTKINPGTLRLARPEAYSGDTIVSGGVLSLGASNAVSGTIGASSGLVVNGGILNVEVTDGLFGTNLRPVTISAGLLSSSDGAANRLSGPLTLAGGGIASGAPDPLRGSWSIENTGVTVSASSQISARRVQLAAAGGVVFQVASGMVLGISAVLEDPELGAAGTGTLVKAGAGIMALSATNTYGGDTIIRQGTLKLGGTVITGLGGDGTGWQVNSTGVGGTPIASDVLVLTTNNANQARSAFLTAAVPYDGFTAKFIYTPSGNKAADGAAFILQNDPRGATALGATGGGMGYSGIANSIAIVFNIYSGFPIGTSFCTGGGINTAYQSVAPVNIKSGNPIEVTLVHDPAANTITQTLVEQNTVNTSVLVYTNVSLAAALGTATARVGFSGATGGQVATQVISNFSYATSSALDVVLPVNTLVRMAAGTTLDLAGIRNQPVGALVDEGTGSGMVTNSIGTEVVLTVGNDDSSGVFSGSMIDGAGSISLIKIGAGTQTLHGACAIRGPTTISNGTLLVNGSLSGTGMVTVSGGTLGGSGVVAGLVVQLGGVVAPGSSPGTLTFLSDYAQAGELAIEIAGTSPGSGYDRLVVGGAATLYASLTVTTNGYAPVAGDSFTILTASNGVVNTFALATLPELSAGNGWVIDYQPNAVVLSVTGAPPPAAGYDVYAAQIPNAADRGYQNDPDGDGYANLLEYATGGNPTNADTTARMSAARTNGLLALRFARATNATDATLIVEGSRAATNNAVWTGIATNLAGSWGGAPNVTEAGTSTPVTVTVADTAPASTNRFLRLRVTRP